MSSQRIDLWLFRARLFKSRSLAARFVEDGGIRLDRGGQVERLTRASALLRPGDRLIYVLSGRVYRVAVLALGERRGPPAEARLLYALEISGAPEKEDG